jgi:hypothetical protein
MSSLMQVCIKLRAEHDLGYSGSVPEVYKYNPAVVAPFIGPSHKGDVIFDIFSG